MKTRRIQVEDELGAPIPDSQALVWGSNAAWDCVETGCGTLLGNRTGDGEYVVTCDICGARYEILRARNKKGRLNLGRAIGVCRAGVLRP